ncbi:hypothetical protein [Campylobacter lari]|uniref:hypothetical protein n=1 Tax=Campylobacter lari TaxID=201 RepID=UPI0021581947|nr:hypothetical protein [Campylobacter lari]MCR6775067.1 hypothetical protein [Campylobacter lari]
MINFILDSDFCLLLSSLFLITIVIFYFFLKKKGFIINNITTTEWLKIFYLAFVSIIIISFIFSAKPDEKFINSLKENDIINQETLSAYLSNDRYSVNTLGFGICKRNNYNGETCHDYLRYVISSLKTKQEELKKEHQENLKKEQVEKQKEQIKLKEKNENIENLINDYSKN